MNEAQQSLVLYTFAPLWICCMCFALRWFIDYSDSSRFAKTKVAPIHRDLEEGSHVPLTSTTFTEKNLDE